MRRSADAGNDLGGVLRLAMSGSRTYGGPSVSELSFIVDLSALPPLKQCIK
jgi:hypothetical protein